MKISCPECDNSNADARRGMLVAVNDPEECIDVMVYECPECGTLCLPLEDMST